MQNTFDLSEYKTLPPIPKFKKEDSGVNLTTEISIPPAKYEDPDEITVLPPLHPPKEVILESFETNFERVTRGKYGLLKDIYEAVDPVDFMPKVMVRSAVCLNTGETVFKFFQY